MASTKQIEANRRNAQKSTGPKTPDGKAVAKQNARKHGILSQEVVACGFFAAESGRDFRELQDRFWQNLSPVGPMEEMLVDKIVTAYWRSRRAVMAESGEVALNVDGGQWRRSTWKSGQRKRFEASPGFAGETQLRQSVAGVDYLMETLKMASQSFEESGELTQDALDHVIKACGDVPWGISFMLTYLDDWRKNNPQGLEDGDLKARHRAIVLDYIKDQLTKCEQLRPFLEAREVAEESARQLADTLPSAEKLAKIQRYETTLERQLSRAMDQLERLQRRRQGEDVPPPVSMEVSHRL